MVALHLKRVHSAYAVVRVAALAALDLAAAELVHEVCVVHQSAGHLHGHEAFAKHFLDALAADHAANVDERHLHGCTEFQGVVKEVGFLVGNGGDEYVANHGEHGLEPPEMLHVHVVAQGLDGHRAAHYLHGGLADEAGGEHQRVHAQPLKLLRHLDALIRLHSFLEAVVHVHLHDDSHIIPGLGHHFVYYEPHEAHTVVQASSELILAVVGVRREELGNEISVSGMDLNGVETCLYGQPDCISESFCDLVYLLMVHPMHESGGVQIETAGGSLRPAAADPSV